MTVRTSNIAYQSDQSGISLLEMLLTVSILSMAFLGIAQILQELVRDERVEATANYMNLVHDAVFEMVQDIDEFNNLYSCFSGVIEIPILAYEGDISSSTNPNSFRFGTGGTAVNSLGLSIEQGSSSALCSNTINPSSLINGGVDDGGSDIDSSFRETLPTGHRLTVLVRQIIKPFPSSPDAMEVIIATLDPMNERFMRDVASAMGTNGGFLGLDPDNPTTSTANIRGAYGTWNTDRNAFNTTSFCFTASDPDCLALPHTANGGYLVSRFYVNASDIAGDYLYRVNAGDPSLNRMNSNLSLGGNNMIGVDNAFITGGDTTIRREIHAQGSVVVGGDFTVGDGLGAADDNLIIAGDMQTDDVIVGGDSVVVGSRLQSNNFTTVGDMIVGNNATIPNLVGAGDVLTRDLITNRMENGGGLFAQNVNTTGSAINAENAQTFISELIVDENNNGLNLGQIGALTLETTGGIRADAMNAQEVDFNFGTTDFDNLAECRQGCN